MAEETADAEPIEHVDDEGAGPGRLKRLTDRLRALPRDKVLAALLALLVVASAALAGSFLHFQYRPDRATDAAEAKSATAAAADGTVAILSYSPDTLERDFASAKSHLTGDFLSYYREFTEQTVMPTAKKKSIKTSAVVVRAALSELHPDSAVVLVFANQSTVSANRPEPTLTSSSILVTLTKVDEKWLISSFKPL